MLSVDIKAHSNFLQTQELIYLSLQIDPFSLTSQLFQIFSYVANIRYLDLSLHFICSVPVLLICLTLSTNILEKG